MAERCDSSDQETANPRPKRIMDPEAAFEARAAAAAALGQASGQTFDADVTWLARVQPFPMEAVQAR